MYINNFLDNLEPLLKYKDMLHSNTVYVESESDLEILMLLVRRFMSLDPTDSTKTILYCSKYNKEGLGELNSNWYDRVTYTIHGHPECSAEHSAIVKKLHSRKGGKTYLNFIVSAKRSVQNHIEIKIADSKSQLKEYVQNEVQKLVSSLNEEQRAIYNTQVLPGMEKWKQYDNIKSFRKCLYLLYVDNIIENIKSINEPFPQTRTASWKSRLNVE